MNINAISLISLKAACSGILTEFGSRPSDDEHSKKITHAGTVQ